MNEPQLCYTIDQLNLMLDTVRQQGREDACREQALRGVCEDNAFAAGYDEGQRSLREKYRAEFAAECERFHNEGHKCATCGRATPERDNQ